MYHIVLVEPEIAGNTGNIARTCAVTGAQLHLIHPLGFQITDRALKRAGLDYWHLLNVQEYANLDEFFARNPDGRYFYLTTKATHNYAQVQYQDGDYFLYGKETRGLPEDLLRAHPERCVRVPMREGCRSLNLSNTAAIVIYEALRQGDFAELQQAGQFPAELPL